MEKQNAEVHYSTVASLLADYKEGEKQKARERERRIERERKKPPS